MTLLLLFVCRNQAFRGADGDCGLRGGAIGARVLAEKGGAPVGNQVHGGTGMKLILSRFILAQDTVGEMNKMG
jgi:hypothetical protein